MADIDKDIEKHVVLLAERLLDTGLRLATAESCTGGWVAKACTDLAGSSNWFEHGVVTYSNEAKQELLGVSALTLEQEGAVSEATVHEMVTGLLANPRVDVAVAISGVAGPGGGSEAKPVGTVWLAWGRKNGKRQARREQFPGDRNAVRAAAVIAAVDGLIDVIVD